MKPSLAVWMPNFNHSQYIGRAIEAIATQSRRPDVYTIIDDASTDASREVIEEYRKKYPWITVIYQEKNSGVLAIMERGVREVTTDYVFMASADDYILPGFFADAMNAVEHYPHAGTIFGQMRVDNEVGKKLYTGKISRWSSSQFISSPKYLEDYMKRETPNHSLSGGTIYQTKALREMNGFREELGSWSDTFTIQAIALRYGAYYIAHPVVVCILRRNGFSESTQRNPERIIAIVNTAASLMRSVAFRPYFPNSYVNKWVRRYRISIFITACISRIGLQRWRTNSIMQQMYKLFLNVFVD